MRADENTSISRQWVRCARISEDYVTSELFVYRTNSINLIKNCETSGFEVREKFDERLISKEILWETLKKLRRNLNKNLNKNLY